MQQDDLDIRNRLLVARLPAMPQILIRLLEHLQADDLGMPELAELIAQDAGMTSKILSVANSSAFHRTGRSVGLEQSLVQLGTDMIKTLVISESVFQTFNSFPHSGSTDLRAFWKASLTAAVIARDLARRMDYAQAEEAYLAGLLHNVGRLALLATAPREYAYNFTARDDETLCAVEQRTLQITHSEAGAWLIERWHLDSFLADSVLYHHEPSARLETAHPLIRIVRASHLLACHGLDDMDVADVCALTGLDNKDVSLLFAAAEKQVARAATHLGIDLDGADEIEAPPAMAAPAAPADPVQQRLSEEVRNMVLVSEIGQTMARQQGETALLESMVRTARMLFEFGNTVVLMENPTGQALVGMPIGDVQRIAEFTVPLQHGGLVAEAATARKLKFLHKDKLDLSLAEEQLFRLLGAETLVVVPLVAAQRCLGVMIGGIQAWQLAATERRVNFLQAFGNQAAASLENAISERGHARRQLASVAEEYREATRRVVHEVNNPLSIIKNYLSVLDAKLARSEPVSAEVAILNEEIDRVGQLVGGLTKLQPAEGGRNTDAAKVVNDVARLFRGSAFMPEGVEIGVAMGEGPVEIEADGDVLKQILVNLVKNAVEALPQGGRIEIASRGQVNLERKLYQALVVSDTGPGLPPDVLANLFAPVRSTKSGNHRGLGLSIVHALVKKQGGVITCRSGRGGTAFEILLPMRQSGQSAPALPARMPDSV
ncbi:HDOD domain-containing protein [Massilia sp. TS11]|uniref:HDOD domain-containing protein n=1 Tax=Massilia sp. TS11 TaxID=2908003 RepID=UPI001EDB45D4|nr:HDOD domain-containing protein [Massilia sp. TS11]MCG2586367.1 HDOD domain-containing protein [Massilia sp. TS11]